MDGNALETPRPDYSAFGKTDDIASIFGLQYSGDLDKLVFAPAKIVAGIENNYNTLKDSKLGYFDDKQKKMIDAVRVVGE